MGSKGSNTTTTNQQQTYAPAGAGYIQNALQRAGQTANLPMNIPQAPVAGFSQDQQTAFQNINNAQGMAQPYINQAQQYFSPQGTQQFLNPYAQNVMAGLQNVFGQQQSQATGQLTQAAGGVGADRIAVGQANLANQQGLAAGQTLSGLYNNAVQQAQSAGYGTAALGSQAQNAALQGAQAQLGSGGLQQQLAQAQLNAPYQQQLAQQAFPYQQAQFLAGITGSLAPGLGGTTTGQGTTTTPAPSIWSQLLGLGTAGVGAAGGLGAFGGSPSYGGGSAFKGDAYGGSGSNPLPGLTSEDYGAGYAEGGAAGDEPIDVAQHSIIPNEQLTPIRPNIPQLNLNPPQQSGGGGGGDAGKAIGTAIQLAGMFLARGGGVNPYADGGGIDNSIDVSTPGPTQYPYGLNDAMQYERAVKDREEASRGERFMDYGSRIPGSQKARNDAYAKRHGYADGGTPDIEDRFDPVKEAIAKGDFDPQGINSTTFEGSPGMLAANRNVVPIPAVRPADAPMAPAAAVAAGAPDQAPGADAGPGAGPPSQAGPAPQEAPARDTGFAGSPWAALMAAGLATAAGTSPYAGVNIGHGGLQGLKTLEEQRAASQKDETIDQAAKRLSQEAKFHEDQYSRMTPYQKAEVAQKQEELGYKRELMGAGQMSDKAVDLAVDRIRAGDPRALTNLGRGAQSGVNLTRIQNRLAERAETEGWTGGELAAAQANFGSQAAAARTAAVRAANVEASIEEAKLTFPLVETASRDLPRGTNVPWNSLVQLVQKGTSDPRLSKLVTAIQGARTAYSQAMSRTGVNTVHAQQSADQLLSTVTSEEALFATLGQMRKEMDAAAAAPEIVRQRILARIGQGGTSPNAPPAAAGPAAAPAAPGAAPSFTGRTASGPGGTKLRERSDGQWVP